MIPLFIFQLAALMVCAGTSIAAATGADIAGWLGALFGILLATTFLTFVVAIQ